MSRIHFNEFFEVVDHRTRSSREGLELGLSWKEKYENHNNYVRRMCPLGDYRSPSGKAPTRNFNMK